MHILHCFYNNYLFIYIFFLQFCYDFFLFEQFLFQLQSVHIVIPAFSITRQYLLNFPYKASSPPDSIDNLVSSDLPCRDISLKRERCDFNQIDKHCAN